MEERSSEAEIKEVSDCINGLCKNSKSRSSAVRSAVRDVLGVLAPALVASPDPRIKALGLGLGILRETVYKKR